MAEIPDVFLDQKFGYTPLLWMESLKLTNIDNNSMC